ncbi:MAG TPA: hypothetical protein VFB89_06285 [Gemmatimonadales bacterium]|nr:hypothetical protein [Gemmatimonadales bacterium]
MVDDMPPQPKTAQLAAADKNEILLAEIKTLMTQGLTALDNKVAIGFRNLDEKVDRLEANQDLQGGELGLVKKEVALIFEWKGDVDQRLKNNSHRAASASEVDLTHESRLAQTKAELDAEKAAREALATKVDTALGLLTSVESGIKTLSRNPTVKRIGRYAIAILIGWMASKGIKVPF